MYSFAQSLPVRVLPSHPRAREHKKTPQSLAGPVFYRIRCVNLFIRCTCSANRIAIILAKPLWCFNMYFRIQHVSFYILFALQRCKYFFDVTKYFTKTFKNNFL
jgi:hypothetical protein